ncbi:hypothetical protein [Paenisporosarcina quisquiliarum]|uniref:hypothetical protein n=1 Tax=Paenisporosarcina quisquiliarum TaxID=365346 RepID=UPI0037367516
MKHFINIILVISFFSLIAGCTGIPGADTPGYLSKEQVLKAEPEADYFELNNKIYVKETGWVEDVKLTKDEVVGEIEDGMASHLPLGTKIIAPKERRDILIADNRGVEVRYLLQIGE